MGLLCIFVIQCLEFASCLEKKGGKNKKRKTLHYESAHWWMEMSSPEFMEQESSKPWHQFGENPESSFFNDPQKRSSLHIS